MSQKTTLITGSEGLLGSSLVPFLKNLNYNVIRHSRSGSTEAIGDLVDKKIVWKVLDDHTPDFIINLAAATNVDECERKPNYAYLLNVRILENIVSWIQSKQSKTHLIHVSTDQVYDGKGPHLEDNVELTNYYSFSKYTGELVANAVSSTVLRTNFFGYSKNDIRRSFSDWIIESVDADKEITVFEDIRFSPLSLSTLVEMIHKVLLNPKKGIYNLGSSDGISKADFAYKLADILNKSKEKIRKGSIFDLNLKAYRPRDMTMNVSKFESDFDIRLPKVEDEILTLLQKGESFPQ
ncbi:SDR family oxidoreductase [Leptospira barantonii]|nr:SDR family oxidoreductase [Leptospira barantonii]